jgi:hypothetical protein
MVPMGGADSDGDGWANEAELRVGSDPLSTNSVPVKASFGVNFSYGRNPSTFTTTSTVREGTNRLVGTLAILDTMGRLENGNQANMRVELGVEAQKTFEIVTLSATNRQLRLKTNPVCMSKEKDSYPVDVIVKDSSSSAALSTRLTVEVSNVLPQITGPSVLGVDENVAIGTVLGTMQASETVIWSLTDNALFGINPTSGVISTKAPIDYEALSSKTIPLVVTATDVGGAAVLVNVTITVRDVIGLSDWLGGVAQTSELLLKYAIGGASSPTGSSEKTVTVVDGSKLSLTAVVRTNDTNLTIVGEAGVDLSVWKTNGVSNIPSSSQTSVPVGCQRRIYSVDRTNSPARQFLQLKVTNKQ